MNITIQKNGAVVNVEGFETGDVSKKKRIKNLKKLLATAVTAIEDAKSEYPRQEGPVTVIAPGVAISSDGKGIIYNGKAYFLPTEPEAAPAASTRMVGFQPVTTDD